MAQRGVLSADWPPSACWLEAAVCLWTSESVSGPPSLRQACSPTPAPARAALCRGRASRSPRGRLGRPTSVTPCRPLSSFAGAAAMKYSPRGDVDNGNTWGSRFRRPEAGNHGVGRWALLRVLRGNLFQASLPASRSPRHSSACGCCASIPPPRGPLPACLCLLVALFISGHQLWVRGPSYSNVASS